MEICFHKRLARQREFKYFVFRDTIEVVVFLFAVQGLSLPFLFLTGPIDSFRIEMEMKLCFESNRCRKHSGFGFKKEGRRCLPR